MPLAILDRRWTTDAIPAEEVLVHWSQMPPSLATWELLVPLEQRFPKAPAWGHAGFQDRGIVSTPSSAVLKPHSEEGYAVKSYSTPSTEVQARPGPSDCVSPMSK